ncbi:MAG: amidohydrolase family protein [Deltaproteobacteria bacterium]|nr:amidohydrolase family protein [Deltaproteobacteria bacterium]MBI3017112.1 amidohydrolase family protein [Deltaproteobacteria bacterium]
MQTRAFQRFLILLGLILINSTLSFAQTPESSPQPQELIRRLLIYGKVVRSDGTVAQKKDGSFAESYVLVENGVIQSVSRTRPSLKNKKGLRFLHTNGYIYPGLIDLHTHMTYNIMPVWKGAQSQFSNRFEWRKDEDYRNNFRTTYKALNIPEFKIGLLLYDEIQALAGGTTLIQESGILDSESKDATQRLVVRGTDFESDLELNNGKKIVSSFEIFEPKANGTVVAKDALDSFNKRRSEDKIQSYIVHLAEGRTGFLRDHGFDPLCRTEFEALMAHPYFSDPANTPRPPIGLIHSSGIDPQSDAHISFLNTWNMGIVWSPVSNLLLYGDTLDIETLLKKGVPVALGSDWSPSGSKHVLDEARMARFYLDQIKAHVSDKEIFQMMTTNAAKMIGHPKLGEIKPGNLADFFILEDPNPNYSPMESLFETDVQYIVAVIIRGRAVYGYDEYVRKLEPDVQLLPQIEGEPVRNKVVYMDPVLNLNLEETLGKMEAHLKTLGVYRNNLLTSTDRPYQERMFQLQQMIHTNFFLPKLKIQDPPVKPEDDKKEEQ